ncbi:MAG: hypothetical protein ACHP6I_00765 [Rickettsiales bacterium]
MAFRNGALDKLKGSDLGKLLTKSASNFLDLPKEHSNIIESILATQINRISSDDIGYFVYLALGKPETKAFIELALQNGALKKLDDSYIKSLLLDEQLQAQTIEHIKSTFSDIQILKLAEDYYELTNIKILLQEAFPALPIIKDFASLKTGYSLFGDIDAKNPGVIEAFNHLITKWISESHVPAKEILVLILSSHQLSKVYGLLDLEIFKGISNVEVHSFSGGHTPESVIAILKVISPDSKNYFFNAFISMVDHTKIENEIEVFKAFAASGITLDTASYTPSLTASIIAFAHELYAREIIPVNQLVMLLSGYSRAYKDDVDGQDIFDLDLINQQIVAFEKLINDGLDINSLSFFDLKIENLHPKTITKLLELGLDPNALIFSEFTYPEDKLELIEQYSPTLANKWMVLFTALDLEWGINDIDSNILLQALILSDFDPNHTYSPEKLLQDLQQVGQKFNDKITKKGTITAKQIDAALGEHGTLLHILAAGDKLEFMEVLVQQYPNANVNALNAKGQTPLFYAQSPQSIEFLINAGADTQILDYKGNGCFSAASLQTISWLIENKLLTIDNVKSSIYEHLIKGNFEHVSKLLTIAQDTHLEDFDEVQVVIDAIHMGLTNSVEPNKYMALTHLMTKAGIAIPQSHHAKLQVVRDIKDANEFKFFDGLLHKFAKYYLDRNAQENHYKALTGALIELDNEFALEVLTINGISPKPFPQDITVFRGMKFSLDENGIESFFDHGHRGFAIGKNQKILGYYAREPWNPEANENGHWELGGTYLSLEPKMASGFACGQTASAAAKKEESLLLEARFPQGYPGILGKNYEEYEIVPAYLKGADIIAIYKLQCPAQGSLDVSKVEAVFINPNLADAAPTYKIGDEIVVNQAAIDVHKTLKEQLKPEQIFGRYADAEDFYAKYSEADFAHDQEMLWQFYFAGRTPYQEDFFASSCDPDLYCC